METSKQKCLEKAFVIKIADRFFSGFSKSGRVMTAWSLAGAKFYLPVKIENYVGLNNDLEKLKKKKKTFALKTVEIK